MLGYKETLKKPKPTPLAGAKSVEYHLSQQEVAKIIYDGQRGEKIPTIAPPIQIFHPIFDDFTRFVDNPDVQPTIQDLLNVQEFMAEAGMIHTKESYTSENARRLLGRFLGDITVSAGPLPDGSWPDGIVTLNVCNDLLPYMILEAKREIGEGGCDSTTQAGLYMKHSLIHKQVGYNRIHLDPMCDF